MIRIFFLLLMFLVMAPAAEAANLAGMAEISGIRMNTENDKTRIVVDASKEVNYETMVLENPRRIVVDLHGAYLGAKVTKSRVIDSRFASKLRVAQFNTDTVRVVVETTVGNKNYDVFSIEGGSVAYRIVMDFGNLGHGKNSGATIAFSGVPKADTAAAEKAKQEEQARLEKEKKEKLEQEKLEQEKLEQERLAKDKKEQERLEQQKKEQEKLEKRQKEKAEKEKKEKEKAEKDKKNKNNKDEKSDKDKKNDAKANVSSQDSIIAAEFTKAVKDKTVCIDPGHGGSDVGAIGPTGVTEKSVTIKVAKLVNDILKGAGANVIMTRTGDTEVSPKGADASDVEELQARCDIGNSANTDIFISLHMDSFSNSTPCGTTGYYFTGGSSNSQRLARNLADGVIAEIGTDSRGVKACSFYVVKHTTMPATLLEIAFISNNKEEKLMSSDEGVKKAAIGIVKGINKYFEGK